MDGDVVMAEGDTHARGTLFANDSVDDLAPRACQHEVVPPPSPVPYPSAEENDQSARLCTAVTLTSENVSRFPQGGARPQAAAQDDSRPSRGIGQSCAGSRSV